MLQKTIAFFIKAVDSMDGDWVVYSTTDDGKRHISIDVSQWRNTLSAYKYQTVFLKALEHMPLYEAYISIVDMMEDATKVHSVRQVLDEAHIPDALMIKAYVNIEATLNTFANVLTDIQIQFLRDLQAYMFNRLGSKYQSVDGYVYFVKRETKNYSDVYKVGYTSDLDKRIGYMGVKLPFDISLAHTIKTDNKARLEGELHTMLKSLNLHVNGEWYRIPKNLFMVLNHIQEINFCDSGRKQSRPLQKSLF